MKSFFLVAILCILTVFAKADETVTAIWNYDDFSATPLTNKPVTITPLFTVVGGVTNFITGDFRRYYTDVDGSLTVTNIRTGYGYRVQLVASVTTTITNYFPTNLSGTVYAVSNTVVPTNYLTGFMAYSIAQADARFAPIGSSGGATNGGGVLAGMLTNATFSLTGSNSIANQTIDRLIVSNYLKEIPVAATNQFVTLAALTGSNYLTPTNLINFTTNVNWINYSSLTVTGCVAYPFLNGTNAWLPWNGSRSIFTKGNTNFLFYESRTVKFGAPCWVFARVPALTNADNDTGILEYDLNGSQALPLNVGNSTAYWTPDDGTTQDSTAIFANTYSVQTNLSMTQIGELVGRYGAFEKDTGHRFYSITNDAFGLPLFLIAGNGTSSGQAISLNMYGIPFGQYVTNNQVGEAGFESGKINYYATFNQKSDTRMGLDLGLYANSDASGGSWIERMVQQPTYYGTPNNGAGGWSRIFTTHWKGIWAGDLPVGRHTYNDLPPSRFTIVASTNDIPMLQLTNQQTAGLNRQFNGTLPRGSFWTDNTNIYIGGGLVVSGSTVLTNASVFQPASSILTNLAGIGNTNKLLFTNDATWLVSKPNIITNTQDNIRLAALGFTNAVITGAGNIDLKPGGGGSVYSGGGSSGFVGSSAALGNVGDRGGYSALDIYGNNTKQIRLWSQNQTSPDLVLTNGTIYFRSNTFAGTGFSIEGTTGNGTHGGVGFTNGSITINNTTSSFPVLINFSTNSPLFGVGTANGVTNLGQSLITSSNGLYVYSPLTTDVNTNFSRIVNKWYGNNVEMGVEVFTNAANNAGTLYLGLGTFSSGGGYNYGRVSSGRNIAISTVVPFLQFSASSSAQGAWVNFNMSSSASVNAATNLSLTSTYNQSGTAGSVDLAINRTENSLGSGTHYLIKASTGSTNEFSVDRGGNTLINGNLTVSNAVNAVNFAHPNTTSTVTSNDFASVFGINSSTIVTNHLMKNLNGALVDYWTTNGSQIWSKQLAP